MRFALLAVLALALTGCAALGIPGSALDAQGTAANLDNVKALVAENTAYTAADATLPAVLKATRDARNKEAVELAAHLAAGAAK